MLALASGHGVVGVGEVARLARAGRLPEREIRRRGLGREGWLAVDSRGERARLDLVRAALSGRGATDVRDRSDRIFA